MYRIIYDIGANEGMNLPYYLLKADRVVAVEANPSLARRIAEKFDKEIEDGRLALVNCVVTASPTKGEVSFYLHKYNSVLSQLKEPERSEDFTRVMLPAISIAEIVSSYGSPWYIKLDVENLDAELLRAMFSANIVPPYVSAESHSVDVFALLVALGRYKSFKLVDGASVPAVYANHTVSTKDGPKKFSFTKHSAGPFGDDVQGSWLPAEALMRDLAFEGLGWKDIHASLNDEPDLGGRKRLRDYIWASVRSRVARII